MRPAGCRFPSPAIQLFEVYPFQTYKMCSYTFKFVLKHSFKSSLYSTSTNECISLIAWKRIHDDALYARIHCKFKTCDNQDVIKNVRLSWKFRAIEKNNKVASWSSQIRLKNSDIIDIWRPFAHSDSRYQLKWDVFKLNFSAWSKIQKIKWSS